MEPMTRITQQVDWITLALLISIIILVVAKTLFQTRFFNFIILPFNNKYITLYSKKDRLIHGFHILMIAFLLLNLSLYIALCSTIFTGNPEYTQPLFAIAIFGLLTLFIIAKGLLQLSNGIVFDKEEVVSDLIFRKLSYMNYSGLVMFLANVFLTYINRESREIVFVSLFFILAVNSIGFFTLIKHYQKLISNYFFYFILYLCALEIAPLVIIASYLKETGI